MSKLEKNDINGLILVDKPRGWSSNAVVNKIKWHLNAKKAGHLGTLDVEGHGLLPVTLGKGTKLFDYFLNKDKVYKAVFRFGVETDTLDLEGKIINQDDKTITIDQILEALPKFIGKQNQMPPQFSAKKVNGQKAYDIARKGGVIELKPKEIEVFDFKLLKQINKTDFLFQIHCSSGTYIRSLARDLAYSLSTYGIMPDIIRTRCGKLELDNAFSLDDILNNKYQIIALETLFNFDEIRLSDEENFKLLNGVKIERKESDNQYKVFDKNTFLGIGIVENGVLTLTLRLI